MFVTVSIVNTHLRFFGTGNALLSIRCGHACLRMFDRERGGKLHDHCVSSFSGNSMEWLTCPELALNFAIDGRSASVSIASAHIPIVHIIVTTRCFPLPVERTSQY